MKKLVMMWEHRKVRSQRWCPYPKSDVDQIMWNKYKDWKGKVDDTGWLSQLK